MKLFVSAPDYKRLLSSVVLPVLCIVLSAKVWASAPTLPENVGGSVYSDTAIEITWDRSTDKDGLIQGYEITRNGTLLGLFDALSFFDEGLQPGTTYSYTIAAVDQQGDKSLASAISLTTNYLGVPADDRPPAPDQLQFQVYSDTAAELLWERSTLFGFRYDVIRDGVPVLQTDAISYFDDSLSPNVDTVFQVIAIDRDGRRSVPASVTVNTGGDSMPPPSAPGNARINVYSQTAAEILWDRPASSQDIVKTEVHRDGTFLGYSEGTSFYDDTRFDRNFHNYELIAINSDDISSTVTDVIDPVINSWRDAYPYRQTGAYNADLKRCLLAYTAETLCPLEVLPVIGFETNGEIPTVDQIMQRVLVTDDWMGSRLEELLNDAEPSLLQMFNSVTGFLIGGNVRPSRFYPETGDIWLDPYLLWLSVEEKNTVSRERDYRSGFADNLSFLYFWRDRVEDTNAYRSFPYSGFVARNYEDMKPLALSTMYHELAHANDNLNQRDIPTLDLSLTLREAGVPLDVIGSSRLDDQYPLSDAYMKKLAGIRYNGDAPDVSDATFPAAEVGALMDAEGAIGFYSYRSQWEDFANLLEYTMMNYHYGVTRNIGFVDRPSAAIVDPECNDFKVGWGVRNRLASPAVKERARWVTTDVFGVIDDYEAFFDGGIGEPQYMTAGEGWCANQSPEVSITLSRSEAGEGTSHVIDHEKHPEHGVRSFEDKRPTPYD